MPETQEPPVEDPRQTNLQTPESLLLVNTGDGKGKSSAAFGTMLRALARGWNVGVIQFVKSEKWHVGEEKIARDLGVTWHALGAGFTWDSNDLSHDTELAQSAWNIGREMLQSGEYNLIIFDEITYPLVWGWLDNEEVQNVFLNRKAPTHIICTGRDAPEWLLELADTATEMRNIHHAYDRGYKALRGIDY